MSRVYVGTSSWADHTPFYPQGLPKNQQISFYAGVFPIVEINSTYYRMMPERNFRLWAERTPPGFVFDVKPYKQLTWHDRKNPPEDEVTEAFRATLQPLRDAGKLGAVHFQFPPWFVHKPGNVDYIRHLRDSFAGDRVGVEFRHRSWLAGDHVPDLVAILREAAVALTVVDEPQIGSGSVPTVLEVTDPELCIVRFHGRNRQTWYKKVKRTADRFDYLYGDEELEGWLPNVARLAEGAQELHLLFNNNRADYAVRNASSLTKMLASLSGLEVMAPMRHDHLPADTG
jgi:uncharacterized protein YecE (DUF72 family)